MNLTSTLASEINYSATHLEFRRDSIEPLLDDGVFDIETPAGTFRMSKADFHAHFPEIVSSVSYRDLGLYHYPMIPYKAFKFLKVSVPGHQLAGIDEQQQQPFPDGVEQRIDQIPGE